MNITSGVNLRDNDGHVGLLYAQPNQRVLRGQRGLLPREVDHHGLVGHVDGAKNFKRVSLLTGVDRKRSTHTVMILRLRAFQRYPNLKNDQNRKK